MKLHYENKKKVQPRSKTLRDNIYQITIYIKDKNMKNKVNTEKTTIDSFTLAIKLNKGIDIDYKYRKPYIKVWESGEYEEKENDRPMVRSKKCIETPTGKTVIGIKNMVKDGETITITITAKLLGKRYFEGITKNNIRYIYNKIMELKEFKCEFREFLKGKVYDVDICKNYYIEEEDDFMKIIKAIKKITKEELKVDVRSAKEHEAIYFNNREKATPNKPFGKIYNKELELKEKSRIFRLKYLEEYKIKDLIRHEATIKNYAMKKNLENKEILKKFSTLQELLNINQIDLNKFMKWSIEQYIKDNIKIEQKENETDTLTEQQIKGLLKILIENENMCTYEIVDKVTEYITGKNENVKNVNKTKTRNRLRKLIEELVNENQSIKEYIKAEKSAKKLLEKIGVQLK